jgi:hypothetical protein
LYSTSPDLAMIALLRCSLVAILRYGARRILPDGQFRLIPDGSGEARQGQCAGHGPGGENRAQRAAEGINGSVYQYDQEQASPRVVEHPRYDDPERYGGRAYRA